MAKRPAFQDQERVAIFIDGSNFYHGLKANVGRTDVDFWAFTQKLCAERKLIRTYYYNVAVDPVREPERSRDQLKFFERLHATPYLTMKLGRMVYRDNVGMEKGVDVKITIDMLRLAWQDTFDTAVLVTGDGDFMDVVEAVKDLGKHVEGAYFHQGLSVDLAHACDKMETLDKVYLQDCWMEKREVAGRRGRGRRPGSAGLEPQPQPLVQPQAQAQPQPQEQPPEPASEQPRGPSRRRRGRGRRKPVAPPVEALAQAPPQGQAQAPTQQPPPAPEPGPEQRPSPAGTRAGSFDDALRDLEAAGANLEKLTG